MKKRYLFLYISLLAAALTLGGCRSKQKEPETQAVTEAATEPATEKATEKETEKQVEKQTEKKTASTEKTSVKPSTVKPNTQNTQNNQAAGATQMCPYCYNQISTASSGSGSTVYNDHVAQEKAWAELMASQQGTSGNDNQQTDQNQPASSDDTAQCPYCYQWFTVSDGSYNYHMSLENSGSAGSDDVGYVTCPICNNTYRSGIEYDTHYCTTD